MHLSVPLAEFPGLLGQYMRPQRGRVALLSTTLLVTIALQLINPQIIRYFIDATQTQDNLTPLFYAGIAYIAVSLAQRLLSVATTYLSTDVGWSATNRLRSDLTEHLLRLDMPFHKTHTPGEPSSELTVTLRDWPISLEPLHNRRRQPLLILGVLVLLFVEDWRAGMCLRSTAWPLSLRWSRSRVRACGAGPSRQAAAEQFGYIEERISGVEDIQGTASTAFVLGRLSGFTQRALKTSRSVQMVEYFSWSMTSLLFALGWALGLGTGAYLYLQGAITIGTVFLFVAYISMLAGPWKPARESGNLQRSTAGIKRIAGAVPNRSDRAFPRDGDTALRRADGPFRRHFVCLRRHRA